MHFGRPRVENPTSRLIQLRDQGKASLVMDRRTGSVITQSVRQYILDRGTKKGGPIAGTAQ